VISPAIGLFCHRRRQRLGCQLDASVEASGPHDFTVRIAALSSRAPLASTASRPNVRDDGQRPSTGQDSGGYAGDLRKTKTEIFLQKGLDRGIAKQPDGQITPASDGNKVSRQRR